MSISSKTILTNEHKIQKPLLTETVLSTVVHHNLSLREVGKKLQKLYPNESVNNSNAYNVLLEKLRSGQLAAGFDVMSGAGYHIEIPADYWILQVTSKRFRAIMNTENNDATFKIKKSYFAEQIAQVFVTRARMSPDDTKRTLSTLISVGSGYEPYISYSVWQAYLDRSDTSDPAIRIAKSGPGALQLTTWKSFGAHALGFCISQAITRKSKRSSIYRSVIDAAKKNGVDTQDWPAESSVRDFVTTAWRFAETLERPKK